jgi:hypothetical protein
MDLKFAGYTWRRKSGEKVGPGPNRWEESLATVDRDGALVLKIARDDRGWRCAEVACTRRLGYGHFAFEVEGPLDRLDPNVVLGLFTYPTREIGPDETHEIDIEFARWGNPAYPPGNYTVWPARAGLKPTSHTFTPKLSATTTVHEFVWSPGRIVFASRTGTLTRPGTPLSGWDYAPGDAADRISREPMPLLINLWLFQGKPPTDGKEVTIRIRGFAHTPLERLVR